MTAMAETTTRTVPHRRQLRAGRGVARVRLTDGLVADGLADARWLLHDALQTGARSLVVDLSGLHRIDGALVASLLCAHRTCRARGGAVVLRAADRGVGEVLRRTGMWWVMRVEDAGAR